MRIGLLLLIVSGAWAQCTAPYTYQRAITVQSGQVTGTLTNFPMTVLNPSASLKTVGNGGHVQNANGYDIIFVNSGGTLLPFEMIGHGTGSTSYDATTGNVQFAVNVASIATGTSIYMCYGAASISTYQGNDAGTWTGYAATMSLQGTPVDTSSNGNTVFATTGSPTTGATGKVGKAVTTTASNNWQMTNTGFPSGAGAQSIEGWINPSTLGAGYQLAVTYGDASTPNSAVFFGSHGNDLVSGIQSTFFTATGALSTSTWYHVAFTYDGTQGRLYLNGSLIAGPTTQTATVTNAAHQFFIGGDGFGSDWVGSIDEIRISTSARSGNWIAAEYNNQSAPGSFYSVGSETSAFLTVFPGTIPNSQSALVLRLTGTGTSWGGTTVFTVSGVSGTSKVSQVVYSTTSAAVIVTTGSTTGTLTVAETITGSASSTTSVATATSLSVSVVGVSNTQGLLMYTAPDTNVCQVAASESPTLAPLIHDVDPALFSGAAFDDRPLAITSGTSRAFPVGTRLTARAVDSNNYSRAAQAFTPHYTRTVCGAAVGLAQFTTANIPIGNTAPEQPQPSTSTPGAWATPTLSGVRTQQIVDPATGALLSPVSIPADHYGSSYGLTIGDGGDVVPFNWTLQTDPNTGAVGYLGILVQQNDARGSLYFLVPPSPTQPNGEVRNLGGVYFGYPSIDENMDLYCSGGSSDCFGGSTAGVVYKFHYQGDFSPQTNADLTAPVVYSATSVPNLVHTFDPTFDTSLFNCANIGGVAGRYYPVDCKRGIQNSFGWEAVFYAGDGRVPVPATCSVGDTQCPRIVAANYTFVKPQTKYCAIHHTLLQQGQNFSPAVNTNMLMVNFHDLDGGTANDGTAFIGATTVGSVMTGSSTVTVDGPVHSFASGGELAPIPPIAPGDVFRFAGIGTLFTLVSNVSNVWTFTPALGDPVPNGTLAYMFCNDPLSTNDGDWSVTGWDFIAHPDGSTVVTDTAFPGGGHFGVGPLGRATETGGGEGFYGFHGGTLASSLNQAGVNIDSTAAFNGVSPPGYGNLLCKHPSYQTYLGSTPWFNDRLTFDGQPIDGSAVVYSAYPNGAINPITGTGGVLYQYVSAPSFPLDRKNSPTQASTGGSSLRDISSPATGNQISPDAVDNYKYCVALKPNECRAGSSANDIFFNVPAALAFTVCTGGDAPNPSNIDACITNMPTYSGTLMQWGMGYDTPSSQAISRNLTYGVVGPKNTYGFPVGKATAKGEFTLFVIGRGINTGPDYMDVWKVKMPPYQAVKDSPNRTRFQQIPVKVPSVPATTDNVVIRFGYAESVPGTNPTSDFFCTSRAEACVAGTSLVSSSVPFAFAGESFSGTSCTSSCTVNVPAISGRVLYYTVDYRNGGTLVTSSTTRAVIVP